MLPHYQTFYFFQSFLINATQRLTGDKASQSVPGSPALSHHHGSGGSEAKANPASHVFIQGWMLLALVVSVFVPKSSKILWFLRTHLNRSKDAK